MLNNLIIEGLKSIDKINLNLSNLTLLSGTNSAGKSTVIQAILLAIHNITNKLTSPLNGHLVSMGDFRESRNFRTNAKKILIEIDSLKLKFIENEKFDCKCKKISSNKNIEKLLNYHNGHIHYLSADRIGSQDLYDKNFDRYDKIGIFGEFAMDYFENYKDSEIEIYLINNDKDNIGISLESQVNYWFRHILSSELYTEKIKGTNKIKTEFAYTNQKLEPKRVRPKNIGSGLSYIISILIVCLASKKDDVIIIENPEIHLHPKAQSKLTEFFTFIANAGIQLIIETHSDHIFNGIRVSVNKKIISTDKISINFFDLDKESLLTKHTEIKLNEYGGVVKHIDGLFDQFDNDLDKLLGL